MHHNNRFDDPTIKEDPGGRVPLPGVLRDVPTEDVAGERERVRSSTGTACEPLCDDGPGGLCDRGIACPSSLSIRVYRRGLFAVLRRWDGGRLANGRCGTPPR